jgi:hypothetical protein
METPTKMHIRARESVIRTIRGQSLTEYSLIFASIAVVAYGVYATMGTTSSRSPTASVPLWPMRAVAFCAIDRCMAEKPPPEPI